jgi:hypothetical protein
MTVDIFATRQRSVSPSFLAEFFGREPFYAGAALCLAALIAPTLFAMALDGRTLLGINVWLKPLRFEIALTVYLATLAWFAGWLPQGVTATRWYHIYSVCVVTAIAAEMIWIGGAAAFGVASHFNETSPIMAWTYRLMGGLAVLLTSCALVYGFLILRDRNSDLNPGFKLSVGFGLVLTFVLTLAVAGYMASSGGHFVGGPAYDNVQGAPLMGWARDRGDLRVAHFFATHAMHFIPAFGFIASLLLSASAARRAVIAFSAVFIAFVGYTFGEALMGRPFLQMLP